MLPRQGSKTVRVCHEGQQASASRTADGLRAMPEETGIDDALERLSNMDPIRRAAALPMKGPEVPFEWDCEVPSGEPAPLPPLSEMADWPKDWVEYLKIELVSALRMELHGFLGEEGWDRPAPAHLRSAGQPSTYPGDNPSNEANHTYFLEFGRKMKAQPELEVQAAQEPDGQEAAEGLDTVEEESGIASPYPRVTSKLGRLDSCYRAEEEEWNVKVREGMVDTSKGGAKRSRIRESTLRHKLAARPWLLAQEPQSWARRVVAHPAFEMAVMCLIVVDAAVAGFFSHLDIEDLEHDRHDADVKVYIVVNLMSLFFIVELIFRMFAFRAEFFFGRSWRANYFDMLMVILALPSMVDEDLGWTIILRTLRLCRLMRLTLIIRTLNLFASLRLMVTSIFNTLSLVAWAFFFTLGVIYIFSLFFMSVIRAHLANSGAEELAAARATTLFDLYDGIDKSMLTLYYVITGGMEWKDAVAPLEAISRTLTYIFGLYMFCTLYGILSILVGIFCERAQSFSNLDRGLLVEQTQKEQEELLRNMAALFKEMDTDCEGEITWQQFRAFVLNEEIQAYFTAQGLNPLDARALYQLLDEIDGDPNGRMDLSSFLLGVLRLTGPARSTDLVTLLHETRKNHEALYIMMQEVHQILGVVNKGGTPVSRQSRHVLVSKADTL